MEGEVAQEEIQVYMNACDCVMLPYKSYSTSGLAHLATSFGRACIAPNKGYFKNFLNESNNFLYDPENKDGLRKAMMCAIEKKGKLLSMGKNNLESSRKWSWLDMARETCKVYEGLF